MGLLTVELYISDAMTLKDKRSVVSSLLERLTNKFNVAAAEVSALDNRRTAVLAVTTVANDGQHVGKVLEAARNFILAEPRAVLQDSRIEYL